MSFTGRRREQQQQPLLAGTSPGGGGSGAAHLAAHVQQATPDRARAAGVSPGGLRGLSRFPARAAPRPILPAVPQVAGRQKAKFVPLPEDSEAEGEAYDRAAAAAAAAALPDSLASADGVALLADVLGSGGGEDVLHLLADAPGILSEMLPRPAGTQPPMQRAPRRRVTLYGIADEFDEDKLHSVLRASFSSSAITVYPDCFSIQYAAATDDTPAAIAFIFHYGVVACWGLSLDQERALVHNIAQLALEEELPPADMEVDEFEFIVTATEKAHIQNDTITLHSKSARDPQVKLAISYALSQSTKLSLYEKRVMEMVEETRHLPEALVATGQVHMGQGDIARLIGKVFIQRAAVNLLSSVLDKPEFFWRAPDVLTALYDRICEYLELSQRVDVLNARFAVLQEMLDLLRDQSNNAHATRLEWIVIILILVEVLLGLFELVGLFGWIK